MKEIHSQADRLNMCVGRPTADDDDHDGEQGCQLGLKTVVQVFRCFFLMFAKRYFSKSIYPFYLINRETLDNF